MPQAIVTCRGRTVIVIAHRLSTVKEADCLFVMKDGEIPEEGSHEDLLDPEGYYTSLYQKNLL